MLVPTGNSEVELRVIGLAVIPKGEPLYSEQATLVEITDESGGEFVKVRQIIGQAHIENSIGINPSEWPVLRDAIEFLISNVRVAK